MQVIGGIRSSRNKGMIVVVDEKGCISVGRVKSIDMEQGGTGKCIAG